MPFVLPPLYPILDAGYFPAEPRERGEFLDRTVRELGRAGVTLLQLRIKAAREQVLRDAASVRQAAPPGMRLILNDHAELVPETGFDGVHLGQQDLAVDAARAQLGPERVIGVSTHTAQQLKAADRTSADYLATGPVFATASKVDAEPAIGLDGVRTAREHTRKPLVAIGGITLQQAEAVWGAGADSIALIGALFAAGKPPGRMAEDFLRLFR